jgi:acylglycerol lipase
VTQSTSTPASTTDGIPELNREWAPTQDPWATVIIVHGLGEHSGRYERTGSSLADAGMLVRSFDLIGCGASGGRRGHIDDWARLLDQVQNHVERATRPLVLLGHSMGGAIALEYALSERPQPDLLVLSAPALGGGAAWQKKLAPILAGVAGTLMVPNALKGEQLSRDPAVGEAYFADPLVLTKSSAKLGAELFASMDRSNAAIDRLKLPTLVLHGADDTIVPPPVSLPLERVAERRLLLGLRHEIFNEPEGPEVVAQVIEWIRTRLAA